jgi:hypothetical protein
VRALALAIAACFLVTSCAAQKPLASHWDATPDVPEHDESRAEGVGTVMAFPNGQHPERIAVRYDNGGMLELGCEGQTTPCPNVTVKVTGFNPDHLPTGWTFAPPEGVYKMARSDDPNIFVVKDSDGQIAAYYVVNKFNPQKSSVVRTFDEAQATENEGKGWHYTGKALEYTALAVLIVGVVAVVALGAAAEAQQQQQAQSPVLVEQPASPTFTRCNPNYAGGFNCFSY